MTTVGIKYMLNLNNSYWGENLRNLPGDLGFIFTAWLADEVVVNMGELVFGHVLGLLGPWFPALLIHHRQACLSPGIRLVIYVLSELINVPFC